MLVIDASVAVAASYAPDGFTEFGDERLLAPPLLWSEGRSALHELLWRREITPEDADRAHVRLESCPVERSRHKRLGVEAWRIAGEFGWAKTYDAEYVALAALLDCRLARPSPLASSSARMNSDCLAPRFVSSGTQPVNDNQRVCASFCSARRQRAQRRTARRPRRPR
jgi:predicted nucleic acid-binding protein